MSASTPQLPDTRNRGGRPTKFTAQLRKRLVRLVALGLPFSRAAHAVRISPQSFITYRQQNPDFEAEIETAVSAAIERRLKIIQRAADKGDTGCARWLLEHLHPESFARNRLEVTGADGSPLTGAVVVYLPAKGSDREKVVTGDGVKRIDNGQD